MKTIFSKTCTHDSQNINLGLLNLNSYIQTEISVHMGKYQ